MEDSKFDRIARGFAAAPSRRSLLKAAVGMALGSVAGALRPGDSGAALLLRKPGEICRKNGDCASGVCGAKDATGRSRCLCAGPSDCAKPGPVDLCRIATCSDSGVCQLASINCDDDNACTIDTCDPLSGCVHKQVICAAEQVCDFSAGCVCASNAGCEPGYECHHGGCFLLNPGGTSQFCFDRCGPSNIAILGGNLVCVDVVGTPCASDAGCPVGQACYENVYCVAPC